MTDYGLGWKRDLPDWRDYKMAPLPTAALPRYVNLISGGKVLPAVWDQGNLGSCTAHAGAAAWAFDRAKQGLPFIMPARLFIYFNERAIENTVDQDAGASIRDCCKTLVNTGACNEALWPYIKAKFATQPPVSCYTDATKHHGVEYAQLAQDINQLKACLAGSTPFIFGFTVYSSFISGSVAATGLVPMPGMNERSVGGHAVCAVGYNSRNYFLCRNSWSAKWGDPDFPGHFWMPSAYLTNPNLSADFWTLRTVSG